MPALLASTVLLLSLCGISLAAGGHGAEDRSGDLLDLLYRFINFALLVIILFWAVKKAGLKEFFVSRSEEIRRKMDDLKQGKDEAEAKYREIEERLRDFEGKKQEIIEQFKQEGLAEKGKIIAEAQERVQQIIAQAESTIQQETEAAGERLKQEVVALAALKAEEIIAREITDKDQEHLIDDFIERVGKIH
ncbi:MAG: F0F1 ATP synthase subunit B [Deltaproteobacteria bacterium]|nr:F0F1 ATP synthase subunit B [Deltaproteobacteria bacterium]